MDHSHRQSIRNTIFVEDAKIIQHIAYEGDQYFLKLAAPKTASQALPGGFVHLECDDMLPMRRPMSLMRVDAKKRRDRYSLQKTWLRNSLAFETKRR